MDKDFRTTRRRWIKLYPTESINGSIRYQLTPSERGVWYDLLCFSSLCSNTGDICDRDGNEFPPGFIANRLNIPAPLLKSTLLKCALEGRIIADDHGLHITNWAKYQSEYDRQKPYRETKHIKESFAEIVLSGRKAKLKEVSPDEFAVVDYKDENGDVHHTPDTIKVKGRHPSGSLILDINSEP